MLIVLSVLLWGLAPGHVAGHQVTDQGEQKMSNLMMTLPGPFDIMIHFDHHPSAEEVSTLGLAEPETFETFDWVAATQVPKEMVYAIAVRPDVVFVELVGPPLIPLVTVGLDVAARAVKARSSAEFSPNTAEDHGLTGYGVNICVVDTGVDDMIHESLLGKFAAGFNAITDMFENPDDDNGHGTHVAAISLGTGGPTRTYRGIAPGAGLVDVKVLNAIGSGTVQNVIKGIDFCIANRYTYNIRVINLSIATPGYHPDGTDALSMAVNAAANSGLIGVACAGNDGPSYNTITSPGAADNAITVGALDDHRTVVRTDDTVASFSSRGLRTNDGDADILDEFKPDVTAPGVSIISAQFNTVSSYVPMSGCSMATAIVSGIAALILQNTLSETPQQVKQTLRKMAEQKDGVFDPAVDPKYNRDYGWGEVNASLGRTISHPVGGTIMSVDKQRMLLTELSATSCLAVFAVGVIVVAASGYLRRKVTQDT
jgi:subtilisin family serine protease